MRVKVKLCCLSSERLSQKVLDINGKIGASQPCATGGSGRQVPTKARVDIDFPLRGLDPHCFSCPFALHLKAHIDPRSLRLTSPSVSFPSDNPVAILAIMVCCPHGTCKGPLRPLALSNTLTVFTRNRSPLTMGSPPLQLEESSLLLQRRHQRIPLGTSLRHRPRKNKNIHGIAPQHAREPFVPVTVVLRPSGLRGENTRCTSAGEA